MKANIFYDIRKLLERYDDATFYIVISSRGPGKTYSTLRYCVEENKFLAYFRRMQDEIERCAGEKFNPFKDVNKDFGWDIHFKSSKSDSYIYRDSPENMIGVGAAISTFENARGISLPECEVILYDEFIRKASQRKIKGEADIFFNMYESINRNREMFGKKPVKCIMCSNAVNMDSEIISELGLVYDIERMKATGQELKYYPERGIVINLPICAEFRKEKEKTALYRATQGTKYYSHALDNEFTYNDFYGIRPVKNISEFTCLCAMEDIYIYRHKSRREFYACQVRADTVHFEIRSQIQFIRRYGIMLREEYYSGNLFFSDYHTKNLLTEYLKV